MDLNNIEELFRWNPILKQVWVYAWGSVQENVQNAVSDYVYYPVRDSVQVSVNAIRNEYESA